MIHETISTSNPIKRLTEARPNSTIRFNGSVCRMGLCIGYISLLVDTGCGGAHAALTGDN